MELPSDPDQVAAVIRASLEEADRARLQSSIGNKPPRRDAETDAAEAARDEALFDALTRSQEDEMKKKAG